MSQDLVTGHNAVFDYGLHPSGVKKVFKMPMTSNKIKLNLTVYGVNISIFLHLNY